MEQKLADKQKAWRALKEDEHKKEHEVKALIPTIERLKGECDLLKRENDKMKQEFTKNNSEFEEYNVYQTLFKMDPTKYAQAIGDIGQRKEAYPIWSEIDFLERPESSILDGGQLGHPKSTKELKDQIN